MAKNSIDRRRLRAAAAALLEVQRERVRFHRSIRQLENALPALSRDEVFDLALNKHTPGRWLNQSPLAVERQLCAELGLRPVPQMPEHRLRRHHRVG